MTKDVTDNQCDGLLIKLGLGPEAHHRIAIRTWLEWLAAHEPPAEPPVETGDVTRCQVNGNEAIVSIPYLSPGEKLYVTNVGRQAAEVRPSFYDPIQPGETRLFTGRAVNREAPR